MKWTRGTIAKITRNKLECPENIHITVGCGENGNYFQWCDVSFGEISDANEEECMRSWPKKAIAKLKTLTNELESLVLKEEENETNT